MTAGRRCRFWTRWPQESIHVHSPRVLATEFGRVARGRSAAATGRVSMVPEGGGPVELVVGTVLMPCDVLRMSRRAHPCVQLALPERSASIVARGSSMARAVGTPSLAVSQRRSRAIMHFDYNERRASTNAADAGARLRRTVSHSPRLAARSEMPRQLSQVLQRAVLIVRRALSSTTSPVSARPRRKWPLGVRPDLSALQGDRQWVRARRSDRERPLPRGGATDLRDRLLLVLGHVDGRRDRNADQAPRDRRGGTFGADGPASARRPGRAGCPLRPKAAPDSDAQCR